MSYTFGKSEKLKSRKVIEQLFGEGKSITRFPLKLYYLPLSGQESKLRTAVSVPKKNFKKAVDRNRVKRLLREAFRHNKDLIFNNIEGNYAFLILYLGKEMPQYGEIDSSLKDVFGRFVIEN